MATLIATAGGKTGSRFLYHIKEYNKKRRAFGRGVALVGLEFIAETVFTRTPTACRLQG